MGRIFITGDTHGEMDKVYRLAQLNKMTADDYFIILGDFGFIWDGGWTKSMYKLQRACAATILFIDGNHENFNTIESLPVEERFGAPVHVCGDRIFHLIRGNIYTINGHKFFAFGGARSTDKQYRTPDKSWWYREEPTVEELDFGQQNLYAHLNEVEFVLTHECPGMMVRELDPWWMYGNTTQDDYMLPARFNNWFEAVYYDAPKFEAWFFGHMHEDKVLYGGKAYAMFNEIIVIEED